MDESNRFDPVTEKRSHGRRKAVVVKVAKM